MDSGVPQFRTTANDQELENSFLVDKFPISSYFWYILDVENLRINSNSVFLVTCSTCTWGHGSWLFRLYPQSKPGCWTMRENLHSFTEFPTKRWHFPANHIWPQEGTLPFHMNMGMVNFSCRFSCPWAWGRLTPAFSWIFSSMFVDDMNWTQIFAVFFVINFSSVNHVEPRVLLD